MGPFAWTVIIFVPSREGEVPAGPFSAPQGDHEVPAVLETFECLLTQHHGLRRYQAYGIMGTSTLQTEANQRHDEFVVCLGEGRRPMETQLIIVLAGKISL